MTNKHTLYHLLERLTDGEAGELLSHLVPWLAARRSEAYRLQIEAEIAAAVDTAVAEAVSAYYATLRARAEALAATPRRLRGRGRRCLPRPASG